MRKFSVVFVIFFILKFFEFYKNNLKTKKKLIEKNFIMFVQARFVNMTLKIFLQQSTKVLKFPTNFFSSKIGTQHF